MSGIRRSASTPCTRLNSSNYVRTRSRQCDLSYESSKDMFCHSIGAWSCDEVYTYCYWTIYEDKVITQICCMLNLILARARLSQLEHLWTVRGNCKAFPLSLVPTLKGLGASGAQRFPKVYRSTRPYAAVLHSHH